MHLGRSLIFMPFKHLYFCNKKKIKDRKVIEYSFEKLRLMDFKYHNQLGYS